MQTLCVVLGLPDTIGIVFSFGLCLDDGEVPVLILKDIIGLKGPFPLALTNEPPFGDGKLLSYAASLDNAPSRFF